MKVNDGINDLPKLIRNYKNGDKRRDRHGDPKLRFERNFIKGKNTECWNWLGYKARGYGSITICNKLFKVHRVSYRIYVGPIPKGMLVCHKCDNPLCVNPRHLFLGTHQDNMNDKHAKGRQRYVRSQWGETHKSAKLTEKEVLSIRKLKGNGVDSRELALRFGVCQIQINAIIRRQYWKHI